MAFTAAMKSKIRLRNGIDALTRNVSFLFLWLFIAVFLFIVGGLTVKALPILQTQSVGNLLFSSDWSPLSQKFGFLSFILSTVWVTLIATALAVPLCVLSAVHLVEYSSPKLLNSVLPVIDILAGIPSVIYGIWGTLTIVPLMADYVGPFFGYETSGYCILSGGIVLALMVLPVILHLMIEVLKTVPVELKEATLSLGATKWEVTRKIVLRKVIPGIFASVFLGFSRAFGETIAVLMVVGNVVQIPSSLFDAGYPIPALIANNYGEMMSIPMYDSALMLAALILFVIIFVFNLSARIILSKVEAKIA